ncbi:MAG: response regulator [Rhodospirillales bacterium]|jgi:CheY-like chemotaxis protein|nr:response regulator [Rhodospirillales bacterium]MDP6882807.1 response regulator [Rhodospirillales bacterium]
MTKKRILIVEDESIIAMDEAQIVGDLGYEVIGLVMTGEEAVEQAGRDKPDLVLMDIKLPGEMDGRDATRKIRELYRIPVIYVTAHRVWKRWEPQDAPLPEGIGHVSKPFTRSELKTEIERLIG